MATQAEKLAIKRRLTQTCAELGIPLGDTNSPGQLALKHDPRMTVQRAHLEAIDNRLARLLATPGGRLMIFTPSQVGKSTRVSRWFPFWWLTMRPADRIVLASFGASLAQTHGAACRDFIRTFGHEYGLNLKPDENTRSDWSLTTGGGMRARGVRGGITGQPMDLGIIDDPFADRAAAESRTIRDGVWEWYSSAFSSRRSPGAREVLVMTRWHQDDLAGRLLDQDGRTEEGGAWDVLHLPAIAMAADPDKGIYTDPLGRAPGELLPHPKIDPNDHAGLAEHWADVKSRFTTRDWNAMAQGTPFDSEGSLLSAEEIRTATGTPGEPRRIGVGVDPSGGGRDSAGLVAGLVDVNGKTWFTHDRTETMPSDQWARAACLLAYEVDATRIVFEKNYGGDMAGTLIAQAWKALQDDGEIQKSSLCPLIVGVSSRVSKVLRAEPVAQAVKTGRLGFSPGLKQLTSEWQMWGPGSTWSPGALDASVHLAVELMPTIPRGARTTNPAKKRRTDARATGIAAKRRTA